MPSVATAQTGYDSLQGRLVRLQVFFYLIAFTMCGLRTYSRLLMVRSLAPDDYIMIVATFFSLASTINACVGAYYGWGLHTVDIMPADISPILLVSWVAQLLFILATTTVKASILAFYLRLANTRVYVVIIRITMIWLFIWLISFMSAVVFQCTPPSAYWNQSLAQRPSRCINTHAGLIVNSVTNSLNNFLVYLLPIPMLWKIQLPKKQRIVLIFLFSLGSVVCVAGVVRLYYSIIVYGDPDRTWWGFELWTWEAIEVNLGIGCACAPALKPLLLRCFPKLMSSVFGRTLDSSRNVRAGNNGTLIPTETHRTDGTSSIHNMTMSGSMGKAQKNRLSDKFIQVDREWNIDEGVNKPR